MSKIFQLRIALEHIQPPVWRRVEVAADTPLDVFHDIIQEAMGWEHSHLWAFNAADGTRYVDKISLEYDDEGELASEKTLSELLKDTGEKLRYEYDFGDGWLHLILLEAILDAEPGEKYPRCTKGKRACPPEDCGGPFGYMELADTMAKKKGPRYKELKEWLGGHFDPEEFDLEEVNERLG